MAMRCSDAIEASVYTKSPCWRYTECLNRVELAAAATENKMTSL